MYVCIDIRKIIINFNFVDTCKDPVAWTDIKIIQSTLPNSIQPSDCKDDTGTGTKKWILGDIRVVVVVRNMAEVEKAFPLKVMEAHKNHAEPVTDSEYSSDDNSVGEQANQIAQADEGTQHSPRGRKRVFFAIVLAIMILASILAIVFGKGLHNGSTSNGTASPVEDGTEDNGDHLSFLKEISGSRLDDPVSPQFMAFHWMANQDGLTSADTETSKIKQRYALLTLYFSLTNELPWFVEMDECDWPMVVCGTHIATNASNAQKSGVTELNMARKGFTGTIPPEISLLAPTLVTLDLAENGELHGSIPDELYDLGKLKFLYLHNNVMTGSISNKVGYLYQLERLYLGNNEFTGPIPIGLGRLRQLRKSMHPCLARHRIKQTRH